MATSVPPELSALDEHPTTPGGFLRDLVTFYQQDPDAITKAIVTSVSIGKNTIDKSGFEHEYLLANVNHIDHSGWSLKLLVHRNGTNEHATAPVPLSPATLASSTTTMSEFSPFTERTMTSSEESHNTSSSTQSISPPDPSSFSPSEPTLPSTPKKKPLMFFFAPSQSDDVAADQILPLKHNSRLLPYGTKDKQMVVPFPKDRPLYLYELALYLVSINKSSPSYQLTSTNCYFYARTTFLYLARKAGYTGANVEEVGKELGASPDVMQTFGEFRGLKVPVHETLAQIAQDIEGRLPLLSSEFLEQITLKRRCETAEAALEIARARIAFLEQQL